MNYTSKQELLDYFLQIPNKTEREEYFIKILMQEGFCFDVESVCREDIQSVGYNSDVSDYTMECIADKVADYYVQNGFYDDLREACEILGLEKINTKHNENA